MSVLIAALVVASSLVDPHAAPDPAKLCRPVEVALFSCRFAHAAVAVCASPGFSPSRGYVQYRFAKNGRVEMRYPATLAPPAGRITFSTQVVSGGGDAYVRFAQGGYDYVVYEIFGSEGPDRWGHRLPIRGAGVMMHKGGQLVSHLRCSDPETFFAHQAYEAMPEAPFDDGATPSRP